MDAYHEYGISRRLDYEQCKKTNRAYSELSDIYSNLAPVAAATAAAAAAAKVATAAGQQQQQSLRVPPPLVGVEPSPDTLSTVPSATGGSLLLATNA